MLLHLIKWKAGNSVAKQFSRFHSRLPVTLRKGGFLYDGMLVNISFSSEAHSPAPLYRSFVQILQIIQRTAADGKFRQPLPIQCRCNAQIHTSRQCKDHAFFERFFIAAGSDASLWHVQISGQDLTQNDFCLFFLIRFFCVDCGIVHININHFHFLLPLLLRLLPTVHLLDNALPATAAPCF